MGHRFRLLLAECLSALLLARTSIANPIRTSSGVLRRRVQAQAGTSVTLPWYEKVPSIDWPENRSSFVLYPPAAAAALAQELHHVHAPLSLDVTVRVSNMDETFAIWTLLKGVVHRLRRQNQILHVNPHYFIATGVEANCRKLELDTDTGRELEGPILPEPDHCARDCTNQGRYCLTPPSDSNATGVEMIQETLRRICFEQLYKASDLRFNEYHEALEACHADPNSNWESCGREALSHVDSVSAVDIDDCVHLAGGTQGDVPNVHLQQEIDQRKRLVYYQFVDLPMISVAGKDFRVPPRDWTANKILSFVCQVFRDNTGASPLGCQVCEPCTDARKCLWTLECDGQPFSMSILDGNETNVTNVNSISHVDTTTMPPLPPLGSTMNPLAPTVISDNDNATYTASTADNGNATYTASTGLMPPHNASSSETEEEEEISQRDATTMSVVILILTLLVCVIYLRSSGSRREEQRKRQYIESTQARWRSKVLDDVPIMTSITEDDAKCKSVRFDVGDMTDASTSSSSGSSSKTPGTWHSFWDFWMAGDQQEKSTRLHDNVNKFSRQRRGVDKNVRRGSINAGKKYDQDGARVKMEKAMRRASLSIEAVFGKSFGESGRWNNSTTGHTSHATINDASLRFSHNSHAAALAEAAASGQTPPRLLMNIDTLGSLAEEVQDDDTPDYLRYSSDWTVGFVQSPSNSGGFGAHLHVVGMTGGDDNTRNPISRTDSNVSAASSGSDQITDVSISSGVSRTRYRGSGRGASDSLFEEEESSVFQGLEDVTVL